MSAPRPKPEKPSKVGADDFIAAGHGEADLQDLPRREFTTDPEVERLGDDFTLSWPADRVGLQATSLREHQGDVHAMLTIRVDGQGVHWGRLNLAATTSREQLIKKMAGVAPAVPWRQFLDRAAQLIVEAYTAPEPTIELIPRLGERDRYLVEPFVLEDSASVIFGDGGAGKGFTALCLAGSVRAGVALPGGIGASRKTGVLYLDWETNEAQLARRIHLLGQGFGADITGMQYRRMTRPLVDDMAAIRADVSRHGIGLVIVDSLAPACGEGPEGSDSSTRTMNALRSLDGVGKLLLAHVSKMQADAKGVNRPYGSVFNQNLPRSAWELRGVQDDNALTVTLYDRKENDAPRRRPITWRYEFSDTAIRVRAGNMSDEPDLIAGATLKEQVAAVLTAALHSPEEIADELGAKVDSVRKVLRRLERSTPARARKVTEGRDSLWCLP